MIHQRVFLISFILNVLHEKNGHVTHVKYKQPFYFSDMHKNLERIERHNLASSQRNTEARSNPFEKEKTPLTKCESSSKFYPIRIGNGCETINFPIFECSGFCHSKSFMWKNTDEIQDYECCGIASAYYEHLKIFCLQQLDLNLMKIRLLMKIKDKTVHDLFENSFEKNSWTNHSVMKDMNLYAGYYTVKILENVTCECKYQ